MNVVSVLGVFALFNWKNLRIVIGAVFCVAAIVSIAATQNAARSGPGMGEVSVILHGAILFMGMAFGAWMALVGALCLAWPALQYRKLYASILAFPILCLVVGVLWVAIDDYISTAHRNAERNKREVELAQQNALLAPVVLKHLEVLKAVDTSINNSDLLFEAFVFDAVATVGEDWPRVTSAQVYLAISDLHRRMLSPEDDEDIGMFRVHGYHTNLACAYFDREFMDELPKKLRVRYPLYCSDYDLAYGRGLLERDWLGLMKSDPL